ncbi:BRO family protein [Nitrosomonas sp. Nm58]|uniref:BRO family protein n=1 Tax=Nitrosomonas sp. Nm58 TaxID=200126 RepID=UPI000899D38D|nr:BRO family protein [Nitrosomonas sp. Nm58]SDY38591.1 BRO family, N-terminal domain [Nitrosomonas sp. Nm58]
MTALSLAFQSTQFDVVDRNNQPWLRSLQIGGALGYAKPDHSIWKLYESNKDEFTDAMTALVELETNGGKQKVRIFSLRGAHLLAMFARTKIAKEFRKWVLDILDRETQLPSNPQQFITPEQTNEIYTLVCERFPDGRDRVYAWSRFNNHFRINSYKNLLFTKYEEACRYIPSIPGKKEVRTLPAPMPAIKPPVWTKPDPAGSADAIRSIQTMRSIITELQTWCHELPIEAGMPLWEALDDVKRLLITGSTEVSEALMHIGIATRYLNRWMGRSQ